MCSSGALSWGVHGFPVQSDMPVKLNKYHLYTPFSRGVMGADRMEWLRLAYCDHSVGFRSQR